MLCKLVSILTTIIGYMTYTPTEMDGAASMATIDSHGPLSLIVNDERVLDEYNQRMERIKEREAAEAALEGAAGIREEKERDDPRTY